MNYTANLAVAMAICILLIASGSGAFGDIIVFKTGRELKVDKTWPEGDQLCFFFHGIKAGVPKSKIIRIEDGSNERKKTFSPGSKTRSEKEGGIPEHLEDTPQPFESSPGTAVSNEACDVLRKDGFCDLWWGRALTTVGGLQKKQTISNLDDIIEYVRPTDVPRIGDVELKSITYAFWQEKLYTVTLWTEGYDNYIALRDKAFGEFGPGRRINSVSERYLWTDALSDIMLNYIKDGRYGMLWLRSRELDRQCQSSRLKSHITYLKWLKSRN